MSIYQIVVKADWLDTEQYRNVHHYEFPGYVPSSTELQEAVDALDADYKTHLQSKFHTALDVEAYDVRRVDVGDLPTQQYVATAGSWSGTETANALPPQVSAMVLFKAPTAFPRTSRSYLFPFTEGNNDGGGTISSGALAACLAWGAAILTLPITAQNDAVKIAVKYTGIPRVVSSSNTINTVTINNTWKTQRRRRPGVGG